MPEIVTGGNNPQQNTSTGGNLQDENVTIQSESVTQPAGNVSQQAGSTFPPQGTASPASSSYGIPATPTIVNTEVPVVVFVGPPSSGKSMILVRLAKYLRNQGYTIQTDPTFLNTPQYQQDCQEFENSLNTTIALPGTVKFLLVKVLHNGVEIAKLLEAPGEDFYTTDPEEIRRGKNKRIESYLSTVMTSNNPKSYVTLLDLDSDISFRNDPYHRDSYAQRFLDYFYPAVNLNRDRIVLLYNKIDKTGFGSINGCSNPKGARKDAEMFYKQLFESMKVSTIFGRTDNFVFKTFCTGMFSTQYDNMGNKYQTYNVADDVYPRELWKEITRKW